MNKSLKREHKYLVRDMFDGLQEVLGRDLHESLTDEVMEALEKAYAEGFQKKVENDVIYSFGFTRGFSKGMLCMGTKKLFVSLEKEFPSEDESLSSQADLEEDINSPSDYEADVIVVLQEVAEECIDEGWKAGMKELKTENESTCGCVNGYKLKKVKVRKK